MAIVIVALFVWATWCSSALAENLLDMTPSISVAASATEEVVPDRATLLLGVVSNKPTASEAAAENAKASEAVIAEIKRQGISSRDIKTTALTVGPLFDEEKDANGRVVKRTQKGFRARNDLEVRTQATGAGKLASRLIDAGASELRSITFSLSDAETHIDALRAGAMKDALHRARIYAEAIGLRLGKVLLIKPTPDPEGQADMPSRRAPAGVSEAMGYMMPIEPGVQKLNVTVEVIWELAQ
jgi:uncharacterized protein YggE